MLTKVLIFLGSAAVTCTFFINFCATIFRCGCQFLWAGAADSCNIHMAGHKHCPWCAMDPTGAFLAMLVPQIAISFWPASWHWGVRLATSLAAFPVGGTIAAGIYGWITGYWRN